MANYNNPYGVYPGYPTYPSYQPQPTNNYQMNQYAFVNGIEGAKSFQLAPNQSILLMDSETPVVFKKKTNSVGQASLDYFKLVPIKESEARTIMTPAPIPSPDYVSKDDFNALNSKLDNLIKSLGKTQNTQNKEV